MGGGPQCPLNYPFGARVNGREERNLIASLEEERDIKFRGLMIRSQWLQVCFRPMENG